MKALVAVKRVPDGNVPLRLKADGTGIDLTSMPMRINPFDETALEMAVQWKEAGTIDEIIAVSIGPAACQETLRHALALGADRAVLITTDQQLEPLAIAKLLHAVAERERPDLFLLGKQSSDEDNAQTGPMLAALLNWPQGVFASTLALEGGKIVVTREIEGGQETLALALPVVISADLRLASPRYLKLPQLLQAKKKPVETLPMTALANDLSPRQALVGVTAIPPRKPARKMANVTELLACLKEEGLLHDTPASTPQPEQAAHHGRAVILAEHNGESLHPSVRRIVSAARQLADDITLLVTGSRALAEQAAAIAGVSRVLFSAEQHLEHPLAENLAPLLAQTARALGADAVLAAATPFGKAMLPRVAALLDCAMLSDIVEICAPDLFVRPIHAGEALATIRSEEPVKVLTLRPAAFPLAINQPAAPVESVTAPASTTLATWCGISMPEHSRPTLTDARIVVAGGRGLGSTEQFQALIPPLADRLNAAIGATRAAVDSGFISNDHQVGQTGAIVAPAFYFAIGLSGAAQHLAGMRDSDVIIAINNDPTAPICRQADYVLEGDLFTLIPQLLAQLGS